ncbi:MAG: AAA family ATPase [Ignavibacteria bacterium]
MNPFILSGFPGAENFCDRENELKKLKEAFENKRNVTLFSLRRMGKSALVKFLFEKISNKANCIYADIYSARNFSEMALLTANAVAQFYSPTLKDYVSKIGLLIKSLGATLSFNELSGKPELKFGIGQIKNQQKSFNEIFDFLESGKKRVLFAFDEFQQIRNFPEQNTEANLRSIIQKCRKIGFIFLGSNKSTLDSIFADNTKPFYQSTQFMHLEEINKEVYSKFIREKFKKGRQKISDNQISLILEWCRVHTYYVQYFCNRLYSKEFDGSDEKFYETLEEILKENEPVYFNYKNLLTDIQWRLAAAVAKEEKVKEPLSNVFIKKYDLTSASSVKRALDALLKKEILIHYKENYILYDVFFSLWIKMNVI